MKGQPTDFWGKLEQDDQGKVLQWHPLFCHCADVAMSVHALLTRSILGKRLAALCHQQAFLPHQVDRLAVLAALHDFGKVNHGFQAKQDPSSPRTAGHLREAQAAISDQLRGIGPQLIDALDLYTIAGWFDLEATLFGFLRAILSHHGKPLEDVTAETSLWMPKRGIAPIDGVRQLADSTRRWFPRAWEPGGDPLPDNPELQHALAGLLMLGDWIGSDTRFFPFAETWPDQTYHELAATRAARAIAAMGLERDAARQGLKLDSPLYQTLFGFSPRGAQQACLEVPVEAGPSITILEAETGAGKTEAAIARFVSLFSAGEVDGLYFALPTRTSATQIHGRVVQAVKRMYAETEPHPAVILAVPGYLRADDAQGVRLPGFEVLWPDDREEATRHRRWAAEGPKRYLAGVFVVGTIDQALLSVLMVKHSHLRGTALLRHLLVIDEVHASDAYMTRLTEFLLERHQKAGGHALLMSATLGGTTRHRLLRPLQSTRGPTLTDAVKTPYPLVSHRDSEGCLTELDARGGVRKKEVHFDLRAWGEHPETIAERALDAARSGAKVLVLRNTVNSCLETQQALESRATYRSLEHLLFRCEDIPAPHHARFAAIDRKKLDTAIDRAFGKQRQSGGCVVVCTQTVQQSLDLDADLLFTDLCPMDVLLQRVGRLHRHDRVRVAGFEAARCVLLTPDQRDLSRLLPGKRDKRGTRAINGLGSIYEDLRIIEATWRVLSETPVIMIPAENRRLVEATVHPEALQEIVRELGPAWEAAEISTQGKQTADRGAAARNLVPWDKRFDRDLLYPSKERISTRLGEGNRRVLFEDAFKGPFGQRIHELTIPFHLARDVPEDATPEDNHTRPDGQTFRLGAETYHYGRHGLQRYRDIKEV